MNPKFISTLEAKAAKKGLKVKEGALTELSAYTSRYKIDGKPKKVVEAYLADRAIRIAMVHGLNALDEHSIRHAIWYYHQGGTFGSDCEDASRTIASLEDVRTGKAPAAPRTARPSLGAAPARPEIEKLSPEFREYLDAGE